MLLAVFSCTSFLSLLSSKSINLISGKKDKKTNQTYKNNKENVIRLSESGEQLDSALFYIKENPRVKLMGLSTKGNLIFKEGINEVRITRTGKVI